MTEHKDPEPSPASRGFTVDLVEAVRGPLLVLDSSLRVQTANPSFYRTFALSPAEVENHLLAELQQGQWNVPALKTLLEDALARKSFGQDFRLEHTFPAYGLRTMLVNVRYFPAQDNRPEFLLLSLEDLTERDQAQSALREIKERFHLFATQVKDYAIFLMTPQGQVASWNEGAERILGYRAEEVQGKSAAMFFTPEDAAAGLPQRELETATAEGRANDEKWLRRKDGSRFWASGVLTALRDESGKVRGFVKILRDLTERKQAHESLRLAHEELARRLQEQKSQLEEAQKKALQAERLAAVGQVITGLAHESRNALQRTQSCLEMLSLVVQDRPQALDLLDRLQKAQDHLQRLYEDASQYAAPITLRLRPHPVAELWRSAWAGLEQQRQGRQAVLREEVAVPDTVCPVDPFRLEQVFSNILDNALAACADPVEIVIASSEVESAGQGSGPAPGSAGRYLRVAVRDNGPGLGANPQKIFEPFYTTKVRGTGLGLAIVKRIVEKHGGWVMAGSGPEGTAKDLPSRGGGAEIVITLPRESHEPTSEDRGG